MAAEQQPQAILNDPSLEASELATIYEHKKPLDHTIGRRIGKVALCLAAGLGMTSAIYPEQTKFSTELIGSDIASLSSNAYNDVFGSSSPVLATLTSHDELTQTYQAVENHAVGNGLYKDSWLYTKLWPDTVVINALYASSLVPTNQSQTIYAQYQNALKSSKAYWQPASKHTAAGYDAAISAFSNASSRYDDDNLWMGLIQLRQGSAAAIKRAEQIFKLLASQWDNHGGGIFWQSQSPGADQARCVVSNAPAVQLGVELYNKTGQDFYLKWSERIYHWLNQKLYNKALGLYNDNISGRSVDSTIWTYNQGAVIGADTALNEVKPTKYPISSAINLADRAMAYFNNKKTYSNNIAFDSIFFENLLNLAARLKSNSFNHQVKNALNVALDEATGHVNSLLNLAGALSLIAFDNLPQSDYGYLFSNDHKPKVYGNPT